MIPARIDIDFAPRKKRVTAPGIVIVMLGIAACYWTLRDMQRTITDSDLLSMSLARYERDAAAMYSSASPATLADARMARQVLETPWSALLQDLESAAKEFGKDIALLEIAPNRTRQNVRLSGEGRSLPHVLEYLEGLQRADTIAYPLLESHEIQTSARERPVRFVIVADWSSGR